MQMQSATGNTNMKSHFALPAPTHKIAQEIEDAATTIRKEIPASAVPGAVLAKQLDERVVEALSSSLKHPDVLERAFLFVQVNNQEDAVVERIGVALAGELMKSEDTHARGIGVRWMERLARLEIYEARLHLAQEKLMAGLRNFFVHSAPALAQ